MRIRTSVLILIYVILVILLIPLLLICMAFGIREPLVRIGKGAMRAGRWVLGIDLQVSGLDALDRSKTLIFMANHLSFLDGPLLFMLIPHPVRVIIKKGVSRIPIVGPGMTYVGFIPVDRRGAQDGRTRLQTAARLIKEKGYSFLIFPEGTRSSDGRPGPFRRGGFFLALETGTPIVPVALEGTYAMLPRGRIYVKKGRVKVSFFPPIPVAGYSPGTMPELMDKVRTALQSGLDKGDS